MKTMVIERFRFEAAHAVIISGKPEELHGHTFKLEVTVRGDLRKGYIIDFLELRRIVEEVIGRLDHKNLNTLFDNPTTENVALWIAEEIQKKLPNGIKLQRVVLWEGEENGIEIEF